MNINQKVIITQSNYIPWKGYFDAIACCNDFVIYDTVQFTRRDWRNRNKIKTESGIQWLTIPVEVKGRFYQKINEVTIADSSWNTTHWKILQQGYKNALKYGEVKDWLQAVYANCNFKLLTDINEYFLRAILDYLEIKTKIYRAEAFKTSEGKTQRLMEICKKLGADEYLSGPSAKSYLDTAVFEENNIRVAFSDYNGYKAYPQLGNEFEHQVSIIDMLFNLGKETARYLKYVK